MIAENRRAKSIPHFSEKGKETEEKERIQYLFSQSGLKGQFKSETNGTTGLCPVPYQGNDSPGPLTWRSCLDGFTYGHRLPRWGLRKFEGFWPKKAGKIPGGKLAFPWDYSQAFPGCFASGLAAKGGRARSTTAASFAILSKQQRELAFFPRQVISAGEGAGDHPLPWGLGPRRPQRPPCFLLKRPIGYN